MSRLYLCLAWLLWSLAACSQGSHYNPVDSLRVTNAEWRTDTIGGVVVKDYHFPPGTLFCSAQHLFVVELPAGTPRRLSFAYDSVPLVVSQHALRHDAVVAVNGSYFDMERGNPICYLRIAGEEVGHNTPQRSDSLHRKYYQYATLLLHDGKAHLTVPDSARRWEENLADSDIMTAGPMLLWDGTVVPQRDDRTFVTRRHNRTALGLREDGTTLLVVADGRFDDFAEGLSLEELTLVLRWLGCRTAINLDGGGSSTLYVKGRGVANYPSDNHVHDHEGERPVSNAILVI